MDFDPDRFAMRCRMNLGNEHGVGGLFGSVTNYLNHNSPTTNTKAA